MSIKAIFPAGMTEITAHGLHQWDYGRKLEIHASDLPDMIEVHVACQGMKEAVVRSCAAVNDVAEAVIPDKCLEQTTPITAWVYYIGETSGETVLTITLPIIPRTKPQPSATVPADFSDKYTEAIAGFNRHLETLKDGTVVVAEAEHAAKADHVDHAAEADHATETEKALNQHVEEFNQHVEEFNNLVEGLGTGEVGVQMAYMAHAADVLNGTDGTTYSHNSFKKWAQGKLFTSDTAFDGANPMFSPLLYGIKVGALQHGQTLDKIAAVCFWLQPYQDDGLGHRTYGNLILPFYALTLGYQTETEGKVDLYATATRITKSGDETIRYTGTVKGSLYVEGGSLYVEFTNDDESGLLIEETIQNGVNTPKVETLADPAKPWAIVKVQVWFC